MPKTRTITALGGADAALQSTIAASDPKRASLAQALRDGLGEMPEPGFAVVNFGRGRVAFWLAAGAAAVNAAFNGLGGTLATLTPVDPDAATSLYAMADGGYVAPVAGSPEYWLTDTSGADPRVEPDIAAVAAVAESDPFGLNAALIKAQNPALSVSQIAAKIEDVLLLEINAGKSAVMLVDQVTKVVKVRIIDTAAANASNITTTVGYQAEFLGTVTDAAGGARQFGE